MRLAWVALLVLAAPLAAQDEARTARRLVMDASRALQAGNAARFLGYFDKRSTPGFERLRDNVVALVETKVVATSVEIGETKVEGGEVQLEVDWLMQLTPLREMGAVDQRRERVQVRVRTGGKPRIVFLDPVDFFRPAGPTVP